MKPCFKLVTDPLDNNVLVEESLSCDDTAHCGDLFTELQNVIMAPAFIIEVEGRELFYFKHIDWETNFLVEAKAENKILIAEKVVKNPSTDYIAQLLKKGRLYSF